jgi:hypothetical protein
MKGAQMKSKALHSANLLRRACTLGIILFVAMFATNAAALPEPKVTITYSLKTADGGAYWQKISGTPFGLGDAEFVFDTVDSMNQNSPTTEVDVTRADPLAVTIEYTADAPGGNIVDGPVELTQTDFGRTFVLTATGTVVTTIVDTVLSRKGTGTLSGSTITWDNVTAPYLETAAGSSDCVGSFCGLAEPPGGWPQNLGATDRPVVLPDFTVFTNTVFGDEFASDNGTPNDPSDDIDRPDDNATVKDTWYGVEVVPEPGSGISLIAGVLGIAALRRLRERGDASA